MESSRPPLPPLRIARRNELDCLIAIDDDACTLYDDVGRGVNLPPRHAAWAAAEQAQWREAIAAARVVVAVTEQDEPIAFASSGFVDGDLHLQQLSVRRAWMRRGIGRALVEHAFHAAAGRAMWLTTYADIAWNRPLYERLGFACVSEADCGDEMRRILSAERKNLPAPEKRVAMVRRGI